MFSPYYAWARRRRGDGGAPAEAHCAINLSLHRRAAGASRFERLWAMTERGPHDLARDARQLRVGPSQIAWQDDGRLTLRLREWAAPWPRRLDGVIELQPGALPGQAFALDAAGRHLWQPIAPRARVTVDFDAPALRWQGDGYLDSNRGQRPLERDFHSWHWSRSSGPDGRARVLYDVQPCEGAARGIALDIDATGRMQLMPAPPEQALPGSGWGVPRRCRAAPGTRVLSTLESGPFYCRSLLGHDEAGWTTMHESLSLQRFAQPWVQALLPFRMPRHAARAAAPDGRR